MKKIISFNPIFVQASISSFNDIALDKLLLLTHQQRRKLFCGTVSNACFEATKSSFPFVFFALKNKIAGNVEQTIEALQEYEILNWEHAIKIPVSMCVIVPKNSNNEIKQIASHPKALEQISTWKEQHHIDKSKEIVIAEGTSKAAELLSAEKLPQNTAVIGPKSLIKIYPNLRVSEINIQDEKDNNTLFISAVVKKRNFPISRKQAEIELNNIVKQIEDNSN